MILRTDTIGHFSDPTETDVRKAITHGDNGKCENYIVKLMIDDDHYLCVWIGNKGVRHRIVFKFGSTKVECSEKLKTEAAIELMNQYLIGDTTWFRNYQWDRPLGQDLFDNLEILGQKKYESEQRDRF